MRTQMLGAAFLLVLGGVHLGNPGRTLHDVILGLMFVIGGGSVAWDIAKIASIKPQ